MSNRKKVREKRRDKHRSLSYTKRPQVVLTEENKHEVASLLGYSIETANKVLAEARSEGYRGVSIPLPPGK